MAQSVTLSSAGTATMIVNPLAKSTTVLLSATNGSSFATVMIEMSLDDPTAPGVTSANMTWALLSSAAAMTSSLINSSVSSPGLIYTVLSPINALRINSTLLSSLATFTLKALQSITA